MELGSGSPAEVRGAFLAQRFYDWLSNIFIERTRNIANTGYLHQDVAKPQTRPRKHDANSTLASQTALLKVRRGLRGEKLDIFSFRI